MATLYRRNCSKLWWIRFQWRGTEVRKSARTTSKQQAMRFLAHTLEECRKLDREGRTRRTFERRQMFLGKSIGDLTGTG
jgi:hypothetical protein